MWAVGLDFDARTAGEIRIADPGEPGPGQVRLRMRQIGVCGTDRELAAFRMGRPPAGESVMALGHEALGQVESVGPGVTEFAPGDWVTPLVRRACSPPCESCARGRRDLCVSMGYVERGIFGLHGYWAEAAVDAVEDLVRVPDALVDIAVLSEPLAVFEKALATIQRLREPGARTALVIGAGPVGILAAMRLQLEGLSVTMHSLEPEDGPGAKLLGAAGIPYTAARPGKADIVVEAAGKPEAGELAMSCLGPLGVCALLGARTGIGALPFREMILGNHMVFGTVNAAPSHVRAALASLERMPRDLLARLIHHQGSTPRFSTPCGGGVKVVHEVPE